MIDERFAASVAAWLRRTDTPFRDPGNNVSRAMAQVRLTRRRRWLWFLPGRGPIAEVLDEREDDDPVASMAPADECAPITVRGIRTMFSATKVLAAAAILALAVGVAGSGLLTTEPEAPAGAPEADSPVWTGDYFESDDDIVTVSGSARFGPAPGVVTGTAEMSDPRVSGDMLAGYQWLCSPNEACTTWGSATLTNDGGTWEGDFVAINGPAPGHLQNLMIWMNGTGEYEGLGYVVNYVGPMSASVATGKIVSAPLPPQVALSWDEAIAE